jgi:hypothetical protein
VSTNTIFFFLLPTPFQTAPQKKQYNSSIKKTYIENTILPTPFFVKKNLFVMKVEQQKITKFGCESYLDIFL